MKDKWITIRISEEEKIQLEQSAKNAGFDNLSTYILWICRKVTNEKQAV
jgi:hypothetical protein